MKYVLAIGASLMLLGGATLPASANVECTTSVHETKAAVPAICASDDTKAKHPDWYRDGGYCNGGTAIVDVTGFSSACPF